MTEPTSRSTPSLEPPEIENPTRPALETLARDQRELIRSFVHGFEDRADLLRWCQEATVVTLGELDPEWHKRRLMSFSELSSLIVTDRRYQWLDVDDVLGLQKAREFRLALAAEDLLPACERAIRAIRWSTVERTADDDEESPVRVDTSHQTEPAMRPGLGETADRQEWVVDEALDGFDSLDDVVEVWVPVAIQASFGEVDRGLAADFWRERPLREVFINRDDQAARIFRESFVATELLPPFNLAIAQLADRSGEAVSAGETTDHSPEQYPSS